MTLLIVSDPRPTRLFERGSISTAEAADLLRVSLPTLRFWARELGIGRKVDGGWRICRSSLHRVMAGELTLDSVRLWQRMAGRHVERRGRPRMIVDQLAA